MTLTECAANVGRAVTYRDYGREPEAGIITSAGQRAVFVRYGDDKASKATDSEALALRLSLDEAVALLPDGDDIHAFVNPAGILVGADWKRGRILDLLRNGKPELSGTEATASGHGIVAFREDGPVFIETRAVTS